MTQYEVAIIGAGINGCGLFRDLCLQGVNCLLIDRGDICEGASAASSRLIHGGIKYLETGEFRLVRESAMERNRLLRNAPHVVKPIEVVLPVQSWFGGIVASALRFVGFNAKLNDRGAVIIELGLRIYDAYSRKIQALPNHSFLWPRRVKEEYPDFASHIKAAGLYHEGHITHAERLGMELVLDGLAANPASALRTYTTVRRSRGAELELSDVLTQTTEKLTCKVVVNAAGAWIDKVNAALGINAQRMGGTKGSHLVVDNPALLKALKGRMIYFGTADGRVNLIYPYFGNVLIGATDLPIQDPDEAICSDTEKNYLLNCVKEILPGIQVTDAQLRLTYCGVRPLPHNDGKDVGSVTRDHSIVRDTLPESDIPILSLIGGKWTTFRAFSAEVADVILPMLKKSRTVSTEDIAIGGGKNYPNPNAVNKFIEDLAKSWNLSVAHATNFFARYGTSAHGVAKSCSGKAAKPLSSLSDYLTGEIIHICQNERVVRLSDILLRRTTIAMEGQLNTAVVHEVAGICAAELRWTKARLTKELEHTHHELERRSIEFQKTKTKAA